MHPAPYDPCHGDNLVRPTCPRTF